MYRILPDVSWEVLTISSVTALHLIWVHHIIKMFGTVFVSDVQNENLKKMFKHVSDPSGPVNPVNSCIFVAVLYFPVFCFCVLYFFVFLVDCTIVVVDLCFHYILLFSVALFRLLMKYNV